MGCMKMGGTVRNGQRWLVMESVTYLVQGRVAERALPNASGVSKASWSSSYRSINPVISVDEWLIICIDQEATSRLWCQVFDSWQQRSGSNNLG